MVARHPVLLVDFVGIKLRKRAHRKRIAAQWGKVLKRDPLAMQIPSVKLN